MKNSMLGSFAILLLLGFAGSNQIKSLRSFLSSSSSSTKQKSSVEYPTPHRSWIKLGVVDYGAPITKANTRWAAQNIDFFNGHPDPLAIEALTNAPVMLYDNYYCLYVGQPKYNAMVRYAKSHGLKLESMFIHYSVATSQTLGGVTYTLPAGSRVPTYGWYGTGGNLKLDRARVIMNPSDPGYVAFNVWYEINSLRDTHYTGLYADNSLQGVLTNNNGTINSGGTIAEFPGTREQASAAYDSSLVSIFKAVRSAFGSKGAPGSYLQTSGDSQGWTAIYPYIDVTLQEAALNPECAGCIAHGHFLKWLKAQAASDAAGLPTFVMATGLGSSLAQRHALAMYYIGTNPQLDYFSRNDKANGDLKTYAWFGALEYNVGVPQGTYTTLAAGKDSGGHDYEIYAREYANALMIYRAMNGDPTGLVPVTVNLPTTSDNPTGVYYPLNGDGTLGSAVSSVNVNLGGGGVYIKASKK